MTRLAEPVSKYDHRRGPDGAPAVLVEYGDYQCPFCRQAHSVVQAVQRRLGPRMQFVFRHFPLTTIHPAAELAAEAAEAAAAQGQFWEMHDALYENQERLGPDLIMALAQVLRLDTRRFMIEVNEHTHRGRVKHQFMSGVRSGVNGTPSFFLNDVRFDAPWDEPTLSAGLEQASLRSRNVRDLDQGELR